MNYVHVATSPVKSVQSTTVLCCSPGSYVSKYRTVHVVPHTLVLWTESSPLQQRTCSVSVCGISCGGVSIDLWCMLVVLRCAQKTKIEILNQFV